MVDGDTFTDVACGYDDVIQDGCRFIMNQVAYLGPCWTDSNLSYFDRKVVKSWKEFVLAEKKYS